MSRRAWVAVGAALVVVSLAFRLWHRGHAFVGWDLVSAQQGACWWSRGIGPTIAWHRQGSFDPLVWWIFRTPVATLLPGGFAWLWPSPWWPFVTTFAVAVASLALLTWATQAPLDVMLLAIAGCAVALTWSVIGFSYVVSAWLPHALVLAAILRCGTVAATLLIGLALSLAMTGQELGQFCLVPVTLAAFGLAPCRGRVQAVCLLLLPAGWFLWGTSGGISSGPRGAGIRWLIGGCPSCRSCRSSA